MTVKEMFLSMQEELANNIARVEEGVLTELDLYVMYKEIEKDWREYEAHFKEWVSENSEQISEQAKEVQNYGSYRLEVRNGTSKWDYSHIPEYQKAKDLLDIEKQKLKSIEAKYKSVYDASIKGRSIIDDNTGEVLPAPVRKIGNSIVILKSK